MTADSCGTVEVLVSFAPTLVLLVLCLMQASDCEVGEQGEDEGEGSEAESVCDSVC